MLHLPFERTEEADETDGTQPTQPEPSKSAPPDWRTTVNLDHIGDADRQKLVIEILETHQGMWTSGRLGEIFATEHRIDVEPGTNPTRSMPYRQGPAMRDKAAAEFERCSLSNPKPLNGRHQSSSYRRKTVPYDSVSTTASRTQRPLRTLVRYRVLTIELNPSVTRRYSRPSTA